MTNTYKSSGAVSPLCERFSQYKIKSPAWKPTLRAACIQRMREKRSMMTNRQRDIDGEGFSRSGMDVDRDTVVNQVMQEELTKLRKSERLDDDEFNLYLSVYEEIRREMYEKEQFFLADEFVELEQQRLNAEMASFDDDAVICPDCLHGSLQFDDHNSFRCPNCGFIFLFVHGIGPDRETIRLCFGQAFTSHASSGCLSRPIVSQTASTNEQAQKSLLLSCDSCAFSHVIF